MFYAFVNPPFFPISEWTVIRCAVLLMVGFVIGSWVKWEGMGKRLWCWLFHRKHWWGLPAWHNVVCLRCNESFWYE